MHLFMADLGFEPVRMRQHHRIHTGSNPTAVNFLVFFCQMNFLCIDVALSDPVYNVETYFTFVNC